MLPESEIVIVAAAKLTAQALAFVAGALVCFDSFKIMTGIERPAHHPKGNALAWGLIALTAIAGAVVFIYTGQAGYPLINPVNQLATLAIWLGLSFGLVWRAAIRSYRPFLLLASATIFYWAGFGLTLLEAYS